MSGFLLLLVLRFVHGFSWGVTTTSNATVVVDIIPPRKRGRGIGYFGASFTIAMATGPLIAMFILDGFGFSYMFLSAGLIALIGFCLILFVKYPRFDPPREKGRYTWSRFIEYSSLPICLPHMLFGITYGGVISFITLYGNELNIQLAGPFFLIIAIGIFIARLIAGKIFDSYGPFWLIISGFGTAIAGFIFLSLMQNATGFLVSAFLIGIGCGILMPTLVTMVNNMVTLERRGAANATISTAFDLGIGLGALFLGMLSEWIGLSNMYLFCTIILAGGLIYYFAFADKFYRLKSAMIKTI
jgi:predicted MFS family arabinose efflux permease